MNQSINYLSMEEKKKELNNSKIQRHLLIIHKQLMMSMNLDDDYNPTKKRKVLIVFDDMIADVEAKKKLSPIVTELFMRGRKLNISLVFISQLYFKVPKYVRLDATYSFIIKIPNKSELQQIISNPSSDIEFAKIILKSHFHI